jgi:hypothetical protein
VRELRGRGFVFDPEKGAVEFGWVVRGQADQPCLPVVRVLVLSYEVERCHHRDGI